MISALQTGPSLQLKVRYEDGSERTIGFATGLSFTVAQGQKMIHTVDTPFPAEIAQGAAPSFVRGSVNLFLPRGSTMESVGLVPYRTDASGEMFQVTSKYLDFRIYDRLSTELVLSADKCKVSSYTVSIEARNIARVQLSFEGIFVTSGIT